MGSSSLEKLAIQKLKGAANYIIWSIRSEAVLIKEKLSITLTDDLDLDKNCEALSIIKLLCEDGPLLQIKNTKTPREAWDKLKKLYNPDGFTTDFLIFKELFNTTVDSFKSIEAYLNKVKELTDNLKAKDITLPDQLIIAWVLNALDESYNSFIANITQALRKDSKAYTVDSLFENIIDESRGKDFNPDILFTNKSNPKNSYKKIQKGNRYCTYCKLTSHNSDTCYFLHPSKAPNSWGNKITKGKNKDKSPNNKSPLKRDIREQKQLALYTALANLEQEDTSIDSSTSIEEVSDIETINVLEEHLPSFIEEDPLYNIDINMDISEVITPITPYKEVSSNLHIDYINLTSNSKYIDSYIVVDSGATINTTYKKEFLHNYKQINKTVNWGKASTINVEGQGDLYIKYKDSNIKAIIKDVLYIPELGINLLSINKLQDTLVIFYNNKVILYKNNKVLTKGIKINRLFKLQIQMKINYNIIDNKDSILLSNTKNPLRIWHKRLGHINIVPLIAFLRSNNISYNKDNIIDFKANSCIICLEAKDKRTINKKSSNIKSFDLNERIYSDLGGPLINTYNNYKYYITFLEKVSKYLEGTLIKNKSDALEAFSNFKNKVELQKNKKIKELFTDNGGEFINSNFNNLLNKNGIIHSTTPPYTKEPNGAIERINLTILNKVRALLYNSKAPKYLWGEAFLASIYLYNITPHSSLGFKSPFEVYNNYKPNTSNIKTWGSLVYYNTNKYKTKLEPRNNKAILIGYMNNNIYKVYDLTLKRALYTRDIIILEDKFLNNITEDKFLDNITEDTIPSDFHIDITSNTTSNTLIPNTTSSSNNRSNNNNNNNNSSSNTTSRYNLRSITREGDSNNNNTQVIIPIKDKSYYSEYNRILYTIEDTLLKGLFSDNIYKENSEIDYILSASDNEPTSYKEAINSSESKEWHLASLEELKEIEQAYDIIDLPNNITPLKGRWVYKKKPITTNNYNKTHINSPDNKYRYKVRWVIQGFNQRLGVDFLETFSTTCRTETWHLILIIATNKGWHIIQFDVKNAFLHADIDSDIYTTLPTGLYNDSKYNNKVAKLKKAIYGLKQAPRLWYLYLAKILYKLDFITFPYDEGIFIRPRDGAILVCHVDDILIINKSLDIIDEIYKEARTYIKIEKLGPIATFLGNEISIDYKNKTINISQEKYTRKIIDKYITKENLNIRPSNLPGTPGIKLNKNDIEASKEDILLYQQYIGSLLFLALKTRPDITYSVCFCARFMSNPNREHFKELYKVWGYLIRFPDLGINYNCFGDNLIFKGYSDSDWANNLSDRKSTSGFIISLSNSTNNNITNNNIISWNSQLQKSVALSSCEAEYIALKEALKEIIYLNQMFIYLNQSLKLGYNLITPKVLVDNTSAIKLAENPEFHKRSKHIEIIYHFARQAIKENKANLIYTPSKSQLADFLTKNVPIPLFKDFLSLANIK